MESEADTSAGSGARARSWATAATLVAAVYVYFLLFAEFAFVEVVRGVVLAPGGERPILAALGLGGIAGSLLAAGSARRFGTVTTFRTCLIGCAVGALAAVLLPGPPRGVLAIEAAIIGLSLGGATVTLASLLEPLAGPGRCGLAIGTGTGAAYAVCNLPGLFDAGATRQAWFAAVVVLLAWMLAASVSSAGAETCRLSTRPGPRLRWWVLAFTALVWMDSAAFFVIQHTGSLRENTWTGADRLWLNAGVHLVAGVLAGWFLDQGRLRWLVGIAAALLGAASLSISTPWASPAYVAGVSLYSAALVRAAADRRGGRWRAAVLFAVAGWTGSALGLGMASDLHHIPTAFVVLAVSTVFLAVARVGRTGAFVALVAANAAAAHSSEAAADPGRGREVYIAEGCINCHSQYVRPGTGDVLRWGPARPLEELLQDRPPLFGNRRLGPDLLNVGNRRTAEWNRLHLQSPRLLSPGSRMPSYARLFSDGDSRGEDLVSYLCSLGAGTVAERAEYIASWEPSEAVPADAQSLGRRLFLSLCVQCHGAEGRGDGPLAARLRSAPADLVRPAADRSLTALARLIRFGRAGTAMAGHETLPEDDVLSLAIYVRWLQSHGSSSHAEATSRDLAVLR